MNLGAELGRLSVPKVKVSGKGGSLRRRAKLAAVVAFAAGMLLAVVAVHTRSSEVPDRTVEAPQRIATDSAPAVRGEGFCDPSRSDAATGEYSSFECRDEGDRTFVGPSGVYGFPIVNRSCVYSDVAYDPKSNKFYFYAPDTPLNRALQRKGLFLPAVNSRAARMICPSGTRNA